MIALVRLLELVPEATLNWRPALAALAAITMTLGNLSAIRIPLPRRAVARVVGQHHSVAAVVERGPRRRLDEDG